FHAYLVTSAGVSTTPVTSNTGPVHSDSLGAVGYMKASPDGSMIALARFNENEVDVLAFDNATGTVVFLYTITDVQAPGQTRYGIEFSPHGKLLYVSDWVGATILQYDLTAGNST